MYKLFALICLSWALSAAQGAELPAEVAAILPTPREDTVTFFDGLDSIFIMGGYDGINLYNEVLKCNFSKMGLVEEVGYFPVGITEGSLGLDGKGNFFYLGGDIGAKSDRVWHLTAEIPTPVKVGNLPEPNRLACSASDNIGNVYMIGGAEGNLEVRKNIVKYNTITNTATVVAQLPIGLYGTSCAMVNGAIYIFGGFNTDFQYSMDVLKFTPETNEVQVLDVVFGLEGLLYSAAVTVGNQIYIVGGMSPNENEIHEVTKFDPITNTMTQFTIPFHNHMFAGISATYVPQTHRIYVVGGFTFENNITKRLDQIFYIQLDWTM